MARKKDDIVGALMEERKIRLKEIETIIDAEIEKGYKLDGLVRIKIDNQLAFKSRNDDAMEEIKKNYKKAGWKVKFNFDENVRGYVFVILS